MHDTVSWFGLKASFFEYRLSKIILISYLLEKKYFEINGKVFLIKMQIFKLFEDFKDYFSQMDCFYSPIEKKTKINIIFGICIAHIYRRADFW